jgi:hypothetical protein
MTTTQINKGIDILTEMAVRNNITIKTAEVKMELFFNEVGVDFISFVKTMNNHPFRIIRGVVMASGLNR